MRCVDTAIMDYIMLNKSTNFKIKTYHHTLMSKNIHHEFAAVIIIKHPYIKLIVDFLRIGSIALENYVPAQYRTGITKITAT